MSFSFSVPTNLVFGQGAIQKLHKQRMEAAAIYHQQGRAGQRPQASQGQVLLPARHLARLCEDFAKDCARVAPSGNRR